MSDLLQKAIDELHKLPEDRQDAVAARIFEVLEDESESEWEERIMTEALGDALLPDGSIDFDKLNARGITMTLEELCPDCDEDDIG